ncbi:Heat stress transcription factor C-1 [Linum perenne]
MLFGAPAGGRIGSRGIGGGREDERFATGAQGEGQIQIVRRIERDGKGGVDELEIVVPVDGGGGWELTVGFRKVDPDKWEFASEWFLRGHKQLLWNVVRRPKQLCKLGSRSLNSIDDLEEMAVEIGRMKQEQRTLEK